MWANASLISSPPLRPVDGAGGQGAIAVGAPGIVGVVEFMVDGFQWQEADIQAPSKRVPV